MKRFVAMSGLVAMVAALGSCESSGTETDNPTGPHGIEVRRSPLPYVTTVSVAEADGAALRFGERAFSLDLYRAVAAKAATDQNLFLGTHSVATLLAMTTAAARGPTQTEINTALKHGLSQEALHPAMNQLAQALRAEVAGTTAQYDSLNSIWVAKGYSVGAPFLDILSQQYDTGVFVADFTGNAEGARTSINTWVGQQTQGNIPELFAAGSIDPTAELVLTNAAYFSAQWNDRFDPATTKTQEFSLPDGTAVDVPMMAREWKFPFAFDVDWRAFELPVKDVSMGMVFVLPNAGEYANLESRFDSAMVDKIVAALDAARAKQSEVYVQVPRFDFGSEVDLRVALQSLGVTSAFDSNRADFGGIDSSQPLYVTGFPHRTTVGVDEYGTTAAVATGEVWVPLAISPNIFLNRPFLFFTYDHTTSTVLFVGRLVRPAGTPHAPAQTPVTSTDLQSICSIVAPCQGRTTTEAECQTSFATDEPAVVQSCANCLRAKNDLCSNITNCSWGQGDVCDPATCAAYCPGHSY